MTSLSSACTSIPPVSSNYKARGRYTTISNLNTYVVTPSSSSSTSTTGILFIYDAFGLAPQTLQGSDRLAALTGSVVCMPDFFKGLPMTEDVVVRDTPEKQDLVKKFMAGPANIDNTVDTVLGDVMPAARVEFPEVTSWAVFGLCWGGKVAVLSSIKLPSAFKASGQGHPGMFVVEDAQSLKTNGLPHICLASKDESAEVANGYKQILGKTGHVERYDTMHHGWMGARANLEDEKNLKEFERAYAEVASFFVQRFQ